MPERGVVGVASREDRARGLGLSGGKEDDPWRGCVAHLPLLKDREHVAGRILEPGDVGTLLAEDALVVLLDAVLAALPDEWRLFYEFLAHTGLRISEAVGLTWAHVELGDRARLLVREQLYEGERKRLKSGNGRREVPLSVGMAARLLAHRRDTYAGPESPVFVSRAGTPLRPSNIWRRTLKPTREAVGLPWVTFHSFRHTCASLLFEAGRNVKQVSEWLGHADPAFTLRRYVHLMDAGVGDADFLDDAVSEDDPARAGSASR